MNFAETAPVHGGATEVKHDAIWVGLRSNPVFVMKLFVACMRVKWAATAKVAKEAIQRHAIVVLEDFKSLGVEPSSNRCFSREGKREVASL